MDLHKLLQRIKHFIKPKNMDADQLRSNEAQRKMIAATYYLYREMLHQYTLANHHNNVLTSPTLTCEHSGEPITITFKDE